MKSKLTNHFISSMKKESILFDLKIIKDKAFFKICEEFYLGSTKHLFQIHNTITMELFLRRLNLQKSSD